MKDDPFLEFLEYIKPEKDFDISKSPKKPDYSDTNNWAALPNIDGQQFYVPDKSFSIKKYNNQVDVFYIHPTGFFEKEWNSNSNSNQRKNSNPYIENQDSKVIFLGTLGLAFLCFLYRLQ